MHHLTTLQQIINAFHLVTGHITLNYNLTTKKNKKITVALLHPPLLTAFEILISTVQHQNQKVTGLKRAQSLL